MISSTFKQLIIFNADVPITSTILNKKSEHIRKLPISEIRTSDNSKEFLLSLALRIIEVLLYLHAFAFPPTILLPSVLEKIRQYQCRIVLIALFWPQQLWFSEFLKLLVSAPIHLPLFPGLLTQLKGRFLH